MCLEMRHCCVFRKLTLGQKKKKKKEMSRSYKQVEINLWAHWQHILMLFKERVGGWGGGGGLCLVCLTIKQANTPHKTGKIKHALTRWVTFAASNYLPQHTLDSCCVFSAVRKIALRFREARQSPNGYFTRSQKIVISSYMRQEFD